MSEEVNLQSAENQELSFNLSSIGNDLPTSSSAGGKLQGLDGRTLTNTSIGQRKHEHCGRTPGSTITKNYPPFPGTEPGGPICRMWQESTLGVGSIYSLAKEYGSSIIPNQPADPRAFNDTAPINCGALSEEARKKIPQCNGDKPKPGDGGSTGGGTGGGTTVNPLDPILNIFDKIFAVGFTGGSVTQSRPDQGYVVNQPTPVSVGGVSPISIVVLLIGLAIAWYLYKRYS